MMAFDHPHVLSIFGICVDAGPAPYIVMPFMANGSLQCYLQHNREELVMAEDAQSDAVRCINIQILSVML